MSTLKSASTNEPKAPTMIHDLVDLLKSYGPGLAGWVLLFVFFAWMMGQGGRLAMRNVKAILDEGETLRASMRQELKDCQAGHQRQQRSLAEMTQRWEASREAAYTLRQEMAALVIEVQRLTAETHRLTAELRSERHKRGADHD